MLHQIGAGVLGPVFRTYEPARDRLVAVKVFRLDITPEQAHALADELQRTIDLGLFHPSIVTPLAAGVEGTLAYLAEEYVAAESLDVAMRHYAPAPVGKVLPFIAQLAGAIDFARTSGVGHGALHPRDMFLTPDEARVTGFGVVDALETIGVRAPVRRPYSAPERIEGAAWGAPADVFALAVITYELLTGRRPAGLGQEITPLSESEDDGQILANADAIRAVLAGALAESPERRPATALAFAAALEQAAGEAAVDAAAAVLPATAAAATDAAGVDELPFALFDEPAAEEADEPEAAAPRYADVGDAADEEIFADPDAGPAIYGDRAADEIRGEEALRPAREAYVPPVAHRRTGRTRPRMLFGVLVVSAGLLVGFLAGYGLGSRDPMEPAPAAGAAPAAPAIDAPALGVPAIEAARDLPDAAREAIVSEPPFDPPVDAPAVPADVPPADALATGGEAVRPSPAPAPPPGRLLVRSTPADAEVRLDGTLRGRTPLTLRDLETGTYTVEVRRPGYAPQRRQVTLSTARPAANETFALQAVRASPVPVPAAPPVRFVGSLYIDSRPRGARVLLNGDLVGTTPLRIAEVRAGSHVVRIEMDGYRPWTTSSRIVTGEETRVAASLEGTRD